VVLGNVADDTELVKVAAAALGAERLRQARVDISLNLSLAFF
jgi:hypothetical protein